MIFYYFAFINAKSVIKLTTVMAEVKINKSSDFEKALKDFKLQCKREGILREFRERQFYTKPSEKRRRNVKKKKHRRR